jgi:hypothetical protein
MNKIDEKAVITAQVPLIEGMPTLCSRCQAPLCLRKQVINLALGSPAQMLCLSCLAAKMHKSESQLVSEIKKYILSRDCFAKEWKRYKSQDNCPDPYNCVIEQCFLEG